MTIMAWDIVKDGVIVGRRDTAPAGDQSALASSKPRILPHVDVRPDYDPVSEVLDGPMVDIGPSEVTYTWTKRAKNQEEINAMQAEKVALIEAEFLARAYAPINFVVGGQTYTWHADRDAIENILGVVVMIVSGAPVPNPRNWTPKGSLVPVSITHSELIGLGAAIAARKDALFAVKKTKQATILAASAPHDIANHDAAVGWEQ